MCNNQAIYPHQSSAPSSLFSIVHPSMTCLHLYQAFQYFLSTSTNVRLLNSVLPWRNRLSKKCYHNTQACRVLTHILLKLYNTLGLYQLMLPPTSPVNYCTVLGTAFPLVTPGMSVTVSIASTFVQLTLPQIILITQCCSYCQVSSQVYCYES